MSRVDVVCHIPVDGKTYALLCTNTTVAQRSILRNASRVKSECRTLRAAHIIVRDTMFLDEAVMQHVLPTKTEREEYDKYAPFMFEEGQCMDASHVSFSIGAAQHLHFSIW